jgi:hypothetical protein
VILDVLRAVLTQQKMSHFTLDECVSVFLHEVCLLAIYVDRAIEPMCIHSTENASQSRMSLISGQGASPLEHHQMSY